MIIRREQLAEANERFRHNVLDEGNGDLSALGHTEPNEAAQIVRKKVAAK
jgi:hypothetical protein